MINIFLFLNSSSIIVLTTPNGYFMFLLIHNHVFNDFSMVVFFTCIMYYYNKPLLFYIYLDV